VLLNQLLQLLAATVLAGNYHNDFNATAYNGDTDTLTGMINSLIAQNNNNQLEVVKTTSDADIATEVSRRDATIAAADATLQAELDRLQKDVNFVDGELVAAQAAQDAQEIIQDAAIADRLSRSLSSTKLWRRATTGKQLPLPSVSLAWPTPRLHTPPRLPPMPQVCQARTICSTTSFRLLARCVPP
jgi:hypothetical protein